MNTDESTYILIQKSSNGLTVKLEKEGTSESRWYTVSDKVKSFVKNLKEGQALKIGCVDKGAKIYLNYVKPVEGFQKKKSSDKNPSVSSEFPSNNPSGISLSTQESIKRQAVVKATATIVASLGFNAQTDSAEKVSEYTKLIFATLNQLVDSQNPSEVLTSETEDSKVSAISDDESEEDAIFIV